MPIYTVKVPFDQVAGTISDSSGGGLVLMNSPNAGAVARRYVKPTYSNTNLQIEVRGNLKLAAQGFAALTAVQAAAWNTAAADFRRTNSLGAEHKISGINLFAMVNMYRQIDGLAITTTPPTHLTTPVIDPATCNASIITAPDDDLAVTIGIQTAPGTSRYFRALVLCTPVWTATARKAQRNDYAMRDTTTIANNLVSCTGSAVTMQATMTNANIPVTTGNVIKLWIIPISEDYVPSTSIVEKTITIAAP